MHTVIRQRDPLTRQEWVFVVGGNLCIRLREYRLSERKPRGRKYRVKDKYVSGDIPESNITINQVPFDLSIAAEARFAVMAMIKVIAPNGN